MAGEEVWIWPAKGNGSLILRVQLAGPLFLGYNRIIKNFMVNLFVDYNIEYAHIYSDGKFDEEQIASVNKTKEIIRDLEKNKKTYSLVVLIDDYHPNKIDFDQNKFNKFIDNLKTLGLTPDYITLESKLVDYKEDILALLPRKEAKEINKYHQKKEKLNCSFLIAGWYLLRLGLLDLKKQTLINVSLKNKPFCGKEIINVLDSKYIESEARAYRIIKKSVFKKNIDKIKNIFY